MKKFIKCIAFMLCVIMICGSVLPVSQIKTTQAAVRLNRYSVELVEGKTFQLKLKSNSKKKITWTSKNKKVATVNKKGLVTAVKAGKTKIIAKQGNYSFTCSIIVKPDYLKNVSYEIMDYKERKDTDAYLVKVVNDNNCNIEVSFTLKYYDENDFYLEDEYYSCYIAKKSYTMMKISNCGDMTKCKANYINVYKSNYSQNIAFLNSTEEYGYVTYNFIVENTSKWDGRSNGIILYYDSDNNLVTWDMMWKKTCAPSGEKIKVSNSSYRKTQLDKLGIVRAELYVY